MEANRFSEITKRTIEKIKQRRTGRRKAILITLHDMTSPGYEWLLPGWVGEERHMEEPKPRVYRYYYDPEGNFYKSKHEVETAWEKAGLIVL